MNTFYTKSGKKIVQILSGRSNVFLVSDNIINILIDTSTKYNRTKLTRNIEKLGIQSVDYLILTHSHFDHAASAAFIKRKYSTRIIAHILESEILKTGKTVLPGGTNVFTHFLIQKIGKKITQLFTIEPCVPDIYINNTPYEIVPGYKIFHTPGHSSGSVSIIVDNEIAIVGDALFGVFPNSVFPPFADDVKTMIDSWKILLDTNCRIFLPAHGSARKFETVKADYEKRINRF